MNDLPSVGTEDAREHVDEIVACLGDDAAMLLRLYGDGLDEVTENMDAAGTLITALVSERDELASRVRELEGAAKRWEMLAYMHTRGVPFSVYDHYIGNPERLDYAATLHREYLSGELERAALNASKEHP